MKRLDAKWNDTVVKLVQNNQLSFAIGREGRARGEGEGEGGEGREREREGRGRE